MIGITLAECGLVPDALLRTAIRRLLRTRLATLPRDSLEATNAFLRLARSSPVAVATAEANSQHYEVPAQFFELCLGPKLKYSCCYWDDTTPDLAEAETASLSAVIERAQISDGHSILELGCGWGSLTLEMAARFPSSRITALSNSRSQREFLLGRARALGYDNVEVLTADINEFETKAQYDRIVSVEMLEHVRNHERLFARIHRWLRPSGLFFAHVFCHSIVPYTFEPNSTKDWMAQHFFTGGIMPSRDLLKRIPSPLHPLTTWDWSGEHYARTALAWLQRLDQNKDAALSVLDDFSSKVSPKVQFHRWRLFFLACAELFGYDCGQQWGVVHQLFSRGDSRDVYSS